MATGDRINPISSQETKDKISTGKATSGSEAIEATIVEAPDGLPAMKVDSSPLGIPGFNIPPFDEFDLTYVAAGNGEGEIETVVYKKATVIVATLTLIYNGDDEVSNVKLT